MPTSPLASAVRLAASICSAVRLLLCFVLSRIGSPFQLNLYHQILQVVELRNAGQSWSQIATALGVSTGTVRNVFNAGLQKPFKKETTAGDANQELAAGA